MRSIDVRSAKEEAVTIIKFADGEECDSVVELQFIPENVCVYLNSTREARQRDGGCANVILDSKEDAQNLIKALRKAIELGWWDR